MQVWLIQTGVCGSHLIPTRHRTTYYKLDQRTQRFPPGRVSVRGLFAAGDQKNQNQITPKDDVRKKSLVAVPASQGVWDPEAVKIRGSSSHLHLSTALERRKPSPAAPSAPVAHEPRSPSFADWCFTTDQSNRMARQTKPFRCTGVLCSLELVGIYAKRRPEAANQ
jgi:hypothetical protein